MTSVCSLLISFLSFRIQKHKYLPWNDKVILFTKEINLHISINSTSKERENTTKFEEFKVRQENKEILDDSYFFAAKINDTLGRYTCLL